MTPAVGFAEDDDEEAPVGRLHEPSSDPSLQSRAFREATRRGFRVPARPGDGHVFAHRVRAESAAQLAADGDPVTKKGPEVLAPIEPTTRCRPYDRAVTD
jgi:hypothetical protein